MKINRTNLCELVNYNKIMRIAELGVFCGDFTHLYRRYSKF